MSIIFTASSDQQSYVHSSKFFEPVLRWLFPHISQPHLDEVHHLFGKFCHLTEYAILAALAWRAIHQPAEKKFPIWRWDEAGLALAMVFAYAATDEFHQIFVPTRTPQISDVLIDTLGGALGLTLIWIVRKFSKRQK